jgi:hypothetical protein
MSPVRRAIILVLTTAMLGSGIWLLYDQLTVSTIISGKFIFGGGLLIAVGIMLLWEDFIAPLIGRKT